MAGYVNWMLVALVAIIFVVTVREGPIHDAAWSEPCHTLETGGSIPITPGEQPNCD